MSTDTGGERRTGAETRAEILRVALRLFTEKGFEGTTTRDISSALGITKSSLYYHFQNKEAIVASLMEERMSELDELTGWVAAQPPAPDLLRRAAVRWIDSTTPARIQAMLLAQANQPVMKRLITTGNDVRSGFAPLIDLFAGEGASEEDRLYVRMAFDTVGAALLASRGTSASPEEVIATARRATIALTA
ncbi:helix-turn-helix domain-containing protein [Umezawaea sp. Da 62-37]|uniref:TetR/AcrR family transcriptional regulator n=1 Tax=Umezawaea sp. Da 62-37 TaxID=3075927 RepID=UPI0028F71828|nr:helix-turn-helix domain-containing protein [Umezawaea sp. Da 62-37]WNV89041.1 helix-turn-helix domain-containing protein [Umezawaea sp. Da 62-37]